MWFNWKRGVKAPLFLRENFFQNINRVGVLCAISLAWDSSRFDIPLSAQFSGLSPENTGIIQAKNYIVDVTVIAMAFFCFFL